MSRLGPEVAAGLAEAAMFVGELAEALAELEEICPAPAIRTPRPAHDDGPGDS